MVSSTLRGLVRRDGSSSAIAVAVMALGIGSVTAMFSVLNAVALRPLAIGDPDRVFEVRTVNGTLESGTASGDFDRMRDTPGIVSATLAATTAVTLTGSEGAENVFSQKLAGDGLSVYGARPERGTIESIGDRSAVISHRLWKRRYHGDPGVAGRAIIINGEAWMIAAVMPERFASGNRADLWMPWRFSAQDLDRHGESVSSMVVRIAPGAQPAAIAGALHAGARESRPDRFANLKIRLVPIQERQLGKPGPTLFALLAAVGLVLLIACLNAGSLLVARGLARRRETAVRAALGARGVQLVGPALAECAAMAVAAALLGSAIAWGIVRALPAVLPERAPLPRLAEASIDATALGVALAAAVVCIFLAGAGPAVAALRTDPAAAFHGQSRPATANRASVRFGAVSAVMQTALSVALLAGAGLLLRSLHQMIRTDPGYNREGVLTARVPMPFDLSQRYGGGSHVAHYQAVLEAVRAIPGVRYAAVTTVLPLGRVAASTDFVPEGRPAPRQPEYVQAYGVSPDYFRVMGIPLRAGRLFDERDTMDAASVLVVNEVTARKYWPGEDPLGKRVSGRKPMTVVGVVGSVRRGGMREAPKEEVYRPFPQFLFALHGTTLVVRTAGPPPESLAAPMRAALTQKFPNHPVAEVRTMNDWIDENVAEPRFYAGLLGGFALLALVIAATGIYGMLAHLAALRRRELGIRLALGARPSQVAGALLGRGLALVAAGVALGAAASLGLTQLLRSQLYGVEPGDPSTLAGVAAVFGVVALLAMAVPAVRAGRVDPAGVLRSE